MRALSALYGAVACGLFFSVFLVLIAFVGDLPIPKTVDRGGQVGTPPAGAVAIDLLLLGLFAVQHSAMARSGFKQQWTRIVPTAVERSTFVLATSLILLLLFWQWQPIPAVVWSVENPVGGAVLHAVFWLGWLLVLLSIFLIDHFALFGLCQAFARLRGRTPSEPGIRTPLLYRWVRHPLYLGFFLAFWAAPVMTVGHLLFAAVMSVYILIAIRFEERDLIATFGERYGRYREQVPMLIPRLGLRHLGASGTHDAPPRSGA